jgi:hypothetical protein
MKKIILSIFLFSTLSMIISCDNETQEGFIKETKIIVQKKTIQLGDELIEVEFIEGTEGKVTLNDSDIKKVENFKKIYPNSIYFIDKDEVRIFKNDNDLGKYLGKNILNEQNNIYSKNELIEIEDGGDSSNNPSFNYSTVKLYRQKYFTEQLYNNYLGYYGLYDDCLSNNYYNGVQLNDEISSFEVTAITTNVDARFYEHCSYLGKSIYARAYPGYPLSYADLSSLQIGAWWWNNWNNEISSLQVFVAP